MARRPAKSPAERVEALRADRRSGASALAREAAAILADAARASAAHTPTILGRTLFALGDALVAARPSMVPLRYAVGFTLQDFTDTRARRGDVETLRARVVERAADYAAESTKRADRAAALCAERLEDARSILTHSASGTVDVVFAKLEPAGRRVVVTESRPLREGVGTARRLAKLGYDMELITDAAAASFVEGVDAVLLGADSVLRDGAVLNKAGSRAIARLAREAGVAVYVVADTFKFDPRAPERAEIEEMDPAEVVRRAPAGVRVRNLYFDRIEPRDIRALVCERGALRPRRAAGVARLMSPLFWT